MKVSRAFRFQQKGAIMTMNSNKFGISDKRGRTRTSVDAFLPHEGFKDPSLCTSCKSSYHHKRWSCDEEIYRELELNPAVSHITCPACQKIAAGYPEGIVTLRGDYLWEHEQEILRLLDNVEQEASAKNPLERVIRTIREEDRLVIETTEEKLAAHLGRVIKRAHKGELKISWAGNPDICRVNWERQQ